HRPPSRFEGFTARALCAIARHGLAALKQAIAGGQYEFPRGIFFGGRGPARAPQLLRDHFASWLGDSAAVVPLAFPTRLRPGTPRGGRGDPAAPPGGSAAAPWRSAARRRASRTEPAAGSTCGAPPRPPAGTPSRSAPSSAPTGTSPCWVPCGPRTWPTTGATA